MDERHRRYQRLLSAVIMAAVADHQSNLRKDERRAAKIKRLRAKGGDRLSFSEKEYLHALEKAPSAADLEPARWIMSDDARPFGFVWCCQHIDLTPERLRKVMDAPELIRTVKEAMP